MVVISDSYLTERIAFNRSVALRSDLVATPLRDFYVALLAKGMKPEMARLNLIPVEAKHQPRTHTEIGTTNEGTSHPLPEDPN
jgi:hypothetical protein